MSSNLYKKQCLKVIEFIKEAELSDNEMDLDLEDQVLKEKLILKLSEYIIWPTENYRQEINTGFEQIQEFLMIIGAIDESYISLYKAPSKDNKDVYMLCKHKYGIHLQEVVDHQGFFILYKIGWSALVHNAKVFSNSDIFKNNKNYFKDEDYLIADSAYPLFSWIITLFKDPQGLQAQQQKLYNIAHSKTRVIIEQAFELEPNEDNELIEQVVEDNK
ncbi:13113_t:CDS:2 [Cetraspora pellucida]|uniref:13113_t:CDS:1 n=1 Tax=Cetraspora pellucida TaxID=1433469 RepID=A0ACA9MJW9_9GLOM|nr:13113_t:CDS:2 [Cetraspora pellucida]